MFNGRQQLDPVGRYFGVLLLAVSLFGSACSGSSELVASPRLPTPEIESTVGPTATSERPPSATPPSRIVSLLENVPAPAADDVPFFVTVIDYAAAYDRVGYEPPAHCPGMPVETGNSELLIAAYDSIDTLQTYFMQELFLSAQELDEAFGLQWCDVEAAIQTNFGSNHIVGRTPTAEVRAAMSGDIWAGRPIMTEYDDSVHYEWDDVLFGEGPRGHSPLAFTWAGKLVVTETMISRYGHSRTGSYTELAPDVSLADRDHVLDVAEELERGGAVSMFLFENMVTLALLAQQDRAIDRPSGLVLAPWQFAGIAPREFSGAGSERGITLVIAHSDAESATRNMTLLDQVLSNESSALMGRPWSEVLRLNSITATGDIVAAHLSGIEGSDPAQIVEQSFNSNTGFLVSE